MQNFRPPQQSPLPIANFWLRAWQLCTVHNYRRFRSFCFEQFFLDGSDANLMMLTADVCRKLNCFFFLKSVIYISHCVTLIPSCDIALSYLFAKVQIANKFLMSLSNPPPIKISCVRHWLQEISKT